MPRMNDSDRIALAPRLVLCLCLIVSLIGIVDRDLWTPDEPRDAAMSLEMSRTGSVVVPHLAGRPFVEKPPLYFAVGACFEKTFGSVLGSVGAVRLSTAFWGLATLIVTFLLARRLFGPDRAVLAVMLLATMEGFVENMHWIRVDAALVFFTAGALWAFAEAYVGNRKGMMVVAGLLASGAFLAKGAIGPIFIGVGWLGLAVPWGIGRRRRNEDREWIVHFACLAAFLAPAVAWMISFRIIGGPDLWREWFWENHFGRMMGTAAEFGHMRRGAPHYYLKTIAIYCLPWAPLLIAWLIRLASDLRNRVALTPARIFVLVWTIGSVLVLTASTTKRDMYLTPVLAGFAMACADAVRDGVPRWCRIILGIFVGLFVFMLAVLATTPVIIRPLSEFVSTVLAAMAEIRHKAPPSLALGKMEPFLTAFTLRHAIAGICLVLSAALILQRRKYEFIMVAVAVAALFYAGLFSVAGRAVDIEKSMRSEYEAFGSGLSLDARARTAGWNLDETTSACLYLYCDWTVRLIDDKNRLRQVVAGQDPEFDRVVITREPSIPDLLGGMPYRIIKEGRPGNRSHQRPLYLVEGAGHKDVSPRHR